MPRYYRRRSRYGRRSYGRRSSGRGTRKIVSRSTYSRLTPRQRSQVRRIAQSLSRRRRSYRRRY